MTEADRERFNISEEAAFLNSEFRKGTHASYFVDRIRKFPRPIVVDFNNVLANNKTPLQVNPDARKFLRSLRKLGNIFIITTARRWDAIHEFLEKNKLWKPDTVLMTAGTWSFITQHEEDSPATKTLREEYLEGVKDLGWNITVEELVDPPAAKRVAPIFNKPWEVPIIDDMTMATTNNPGMLGINVKAWEPNPDEGLQRSNENKHSLEEAVKIVRCHFSEIF